MKLCFSIAILIVILMPSILLTAYRFFVAEQRTRLRRILISLIMTCCIGLTFFALSFGALLISIARTNDASAVLAADENGRGDIIIVFGCKTDGYTPSRSLRLRLDAALALLEARREALCVVSGGQGPDESVSEAESMLSYLVERGIAPERIIIEDGSTNTSENFKMSLDAIVAAVGVGEHRIFTVSSPYHLPRISMMASKFGVKTIPIACDDPSFVGSVREYLAVWKFVLLGR